jgi:hypothetical protein
MGSKWKKLRGVIAVSVLLGTTGIASSASAAVPKVGPARKITATIKSGQGLTLLVVSGTGRTLASQKLTKSTQKVSVSTPAVSKTTGITIQFVNSTGEYFGPAVLNWKGSKSSSAKTVYSRLKNSSAKTIGLGTLSIKKVGAAKKQGYAIASKKLTVTSTSSADATDALKGRPLGVGSYGKTGKTSASSVRSSALVSNNPPGPPAPPIPEGPVAADAETLGGDKDKDGVINAFDVDDDGDAKLDAADSDTPTPQVSADDGTKDCGAIRWNIFTNYKATAGNYADTINAYASGSREATREKIASTITNSMTMVFQPITQVCGSAVVDTAIKGNNVSYAPADYELLKGKCSTGDYQWSIGAGTMCGFGGSGGSYPFSRPVTFTGNDLPSGQDTFTMKVKTADGKSYEFTSSPGFVFVTHPMILSHDAGAGAQSVDYNTQNIAPIAVSSSSQLTLKILRPQRLAFDGEAADFYDLGGYRYTADIPNNVNNGPGGPGKCDASTTTDTALTSDQPINKTAPPTMTLTWNIGKCFADRKVTWGAGKLTVDIQVEPTGPGGNSAQKLFLQLS